jgi:cellobiose phosphorylase
MQYGYFDDDAREYVITRPDTPRSWSNYLGSTEYGAIITNNAGGYSFFRSAAQGRFTRLRFNSVPVDQPGRYFYLRDNNDGDFWSTSWQPVGKPLDSFKSTCRHGTAYSVIESEYSNIKSEATYFVPLGQNFEYWRLKITNNDSKERDLSLFTYVEFANNWTVIQDLINLQFSQYIVKTDVTDNIIQCAVLGNLPADESDFQNNDQGRWSWLALSGADIAGYDTSRESFIGPYRTYANPIAVDNGECSASLAHGDNACGSFQANVLLQSGETREIVVMLGVGKAEEVGRAMVNEYSNPQRVEEELQKLKGSWHSKLGRLTVKTPDADFDHMINVWNAYNCLITFAWSRSASLVYNGERDGLGYRDTVQDILGVLPALQDQARERLELMLTGQLANGGAMPVVKPFAHAPGHEEEPPLEEYRSDDCLWLFNTVPAYVAETGDIGFYDKTLPYADSGEATVLGHLRRAIEFNLERSGAHGLPCGLSADWNDCLRLGYHGETVFVTFQLRLAMKVYGEISALLGPQRREAWANEQLRVLDAAIQQHTWDGEWLCALSAKMVLFSVTEPLMKARYFLIRRCGRSSAARLRMSRPLRR